MLAPADSDAATRNASLAPPRDAARPADFRPDIQALRALAVLLVVVYHLWPHRLTGGYVGVDVFFVISGYLIGSHLWREVSATGTLRIGRFWARRARRLLPSALLVIAATVATSHVLAPADAAARFVKEAIASTLYAENWFLASQAVDYLGADAAPSPYQHFWSLSVEEQFYILLPLMLIAVLALVRRAAADLRTVVTWVLVGIGLASFLYSLVLTQQSAAAYFSTLTRLWEFVLGVVLAIGVTRPLPKRARAWVASAGLALVMAAAVALGSGTPYPGTAALLPASGTALLLLAGAGTFVSRIGEQKVVSHLGRVSYAVYLWHWPIIVLVPLATGAPLTWTQKLAILGVTVALATASTVWVEDPVRFSPRLLGGRRPVTVFTWVVVGMVAVLGLAAGSSELHARAEREAVARAIEYEKTLGDCKGAGTVLMPELCANIGAPSEFVPPLSDLVQGDANRDECWNNPGQDDANFHLCTLTPRPAVDHRFLILGDSHSAMMMAAYREIQNQRGWEYDAAGRSACEFTAAKATGDPVDWQAGCDTWRAAALATARAGTDYDAVIVTQFARQMDDADFGRAVDGLVEAWSQVPSGVPIIAIGDNPFMSQDHMRCLEVNGPAESARCAWPAEQMLIRDPQREAAKRVPGATYIDLSDVYCPEGMCSAVIGGLVVYREDGHHLTPTFARTLATTLAERIEAVLPDAGPLKSL